MKLKNSPFYLFIITLFLALNLPTNNSIQANPDHHNHHNHSTSEQEKMGETMGDMMNHDHKMGQGNHDHHHKPLDISNRTDIPSIEVKAYPDNIQGWNLEIKTVNFEFTPENLDQDSNPNQGHAHLYVNGEKMTRIYSNWYYISELPQGENQIKVTLNTDNHESLVYNGKEINDLVVIDNK